MYFMRALKCHRCGEKYSFDEPPLKCKRCKAIFLEVTYDYDAIAKEISRDQLKGRLPLVIFKWIEFLPIKDRSRIVTLGERETYLIKSKILAEKIGVKELYIKDETSHSTCSFKDRSMSVAMTKAQEFGANTVSIASSGNAGAAAAAYAARA